MELSRSLILNGILQNRCIDCSDAVLIPGSAVAVHFRAHMPPVLISAKQQYPPDSKYPDTPPTLTEFERLSLACRAELLGLDAGIPADDGRWRHHANRTITADDLVSAICDAAQSVRKEHAPEAAPSGVEREPTGRLSHLRARRGLQLVGAHIDGDISLVNADLPFSLRLIGCTIGGAVIVDRCQLASLDLSGSAVRGIFATYLNASGSVRMRRTLSTSVVDFGGARISGVFDSSDLVALPLDDPSATESFVGDRGIFNLSLATVENEVRFNRARIYGGLTMKGCTISRSLFMDDAVLRSPLAVLEKIAHDALAMVRLDRALPPSSRAHAIADQDIAEVIHPRESPDGSAGSDGDNTGNLRDLETLKGFDLDLYIANDPPRRRLLRRLLGESMRTRTSSLRGDGLTVKGSIFAKGLRSGGRLRFKYASFGGGLHLDGARLRSSIAVFAGIADAHESAIEYARKNHDAGDNGSVVRHRLHWVREVYRETRLAARKREPAENDDYALDMRGSRIAGSLRLGRDKRDRRPPAQAHPASQLHAKTVRFVADALRGQPDDAVVSKCPPMAATYVLGALVLEGADITGDLDVSDIVLNVHSERGLPRGATLNIARAHVGGDVDLRRAVNLTTIMAAGMRADGSLLMAAPVEFVEEADQWAPLRDRAVIAPASASVIATAKLLGKSVSRTFDFTGATFGADASFVFDWRYGPSLRLRRARIAGKLQILPATGSLEFESPDAEALDHTDRVAIEMARTSAFMSTDVEQRHEALPYLDLCNATALVFAHPPTAWPALGKLLIDGFRYEQVREYGPLMPRRRSLAMTSNDMLFNLQTLSVWLCVAILGAFVLALAPLQFADVFTRFGTFNTASMAFVLVVAMAKSLLWHFSRPSVHSARPLALRWLKLQNTRASNYRTESRAPSIEGYQQAARVLRAAGRIQSANLVDLKRLRRRRHLLSWRSHFPAKAFLFAVDGLTQYGFSPARTFGIAVLLVLGSAAAFHQADRCGFIAPSEGNYIVQGLPHPASTEMHVATSPANVSDWKDNGQGYAANAPAPYPQFNAFLFAADVAIPVLDLRQERYWQALASPTPHEAVPAYCKPSGGLLRTWTVMLQVLGWLLATAIAISLLSRAEAMIAKTEQ